jgi:hypothetical protein
MARRSASMAVAASSAQCPWPLKFDIHPPERTGDGRRPVRLLVGQHPRTRLSDGSTLVWRTPQALHGMATAVDAELLGQPVPPTLALRFPDLPRPEFWSQWTQAEVTAKLLDTPILLWLRAHGLKAGPGLAIRCLTLGSMIVSVGWRPPHGGQSTAPAGTRPRNPHPNDWTGATHGV